MSWLNNSHLNTCLDKICNTRGEKEERKKKRENVLKVIPLIALITKHVQICFVEGYMAETAILQSTTHFPFR